MADGAHAAARMSASLRAGRPALWCLHGASMWFTQKGGFSAWALLHVPRLWLDHIPGRFGFPARLGHLRAFPLNLRALVRREAEYAVNSAWYHNTTGRRRREPQGANLEISSSLIEQRHAEIT